MSRWFRSYVGTARDPKLVGVAVKSKQTVERVLFLWQCVLESAAEKNDNGTFIINGDEVAYFLRCDTPEIDRILESMRDAALIDGNQIIKWGERQFVKPEKTDNTNAERQARHREKVNENNARPTVTPNVTPSNGVTNAKSSVSVSVSVSDSGSESEKLDSNSAGACTREAMPDPGPPMSWERAFELFWEIFPKKKDRGHAERVFRVAYEKNRVPLQTLLDGAALEAKRFPPGSDKQFCKNPATWLNGKCWADEHYSGPGGARPPQGGRPTAASRLLKMYATPEDLSDESSSSVPFQRSSAADVARPGEGGGGFALAASPGGAHNLLDLKALGSG